MFAEFVEKSKGRVNIVAQPDLFLLHFSFHLTTSDFFGMKEYKKINIRSLLMQIAVKYVRYLNANPLILFKQIPNCIFNCYSMKLLGNNKLETDLSKSMQLNLMSEFE